MLALLNVRLRYALLIGVAIVIASATQALSDSTGVLRGHVTDVETHQLVSAVDVNLVGDNGFAYHGHGDKHGFYLVVGVEPGIYRVRFSRDGYGPGVEFGVVVCPSGSSQLDTWLEPLGSNTSRDRFFWGHSLTTYGLTSGGYFLDLTAEPALTNC